MELRYIFGILWRRRTLVAGVFAAIFLTIVTATLLITPRYDSTARVLIRKSYANAALLKGIGLADQTTTTSSLSDTDRADYLALASLTGVAEKTIAELKLKRVRTRARLMNAVPGLGAVLRSIGVDTQATAEAMTAERLLESSLITRIFPRPYAEVSQYEETDIIEIKGVSPVPAEAMNIANAMARHFMDEEQQRIRKEYAGAKEFIDKNIERSKNDYLAALEAIRKLKETEKFSSIQDETTTLVEKLADFRKSIEDNNLAILMKKASIDNMTAQLKAVPMLQKSSQTYKESEAVLNLKESLQALHLTLAESRMKYTKEHPVVIETENKIAEIKRLLEQEMKVFGEETVSLNSVYEDLISKIASAYADLASYESQAKVLPEVVARYEDEMMKLPKRVAESARLEVASTVAQDVYSSLLQYRNQIGMAESSAVSDVYLVDTAVEAEKDSSKHKKPSLIVNTVLALVLGGMFSVGGALLVEYLDDTIHDAGDLPVVHRDAFLGDVFRLKRGEQRLISHPPPNVALQECFRTIRHSLASRLDGNPPKSVTVTSVTPGEGKSFVAANLALSSAIAGRSTVIVDANFRKPSVQDHFGGVQGKGLSDYLAGQAELQEIVTDTDINGLRAITTGTALADAGHLVESPRFGDLMRGLTAQYDMVIVDSPALSQTRDAQIIGGSTAGLLVVVRADSVSKGHFTAAMESCARTRVPLAGVVMNAVPAHTAISRRS